MARSAHLPLSGRAEPVNTLATADAFRSIAELGGDLAFILDCASGLPVYISPNVNEMLGYGVLDVHEQLLTNKEGPLAPLCAGLQERLRRYATGDGSRLRVVREFDILRPDGREVPVEVISTLLLDEAGRAQALAGLVRDQSARRESEREQKRFASMLNHEFRTPLSTIDGAIQRLEATNTRDLDPEKGAATLTAFTAATIASVVPLLPKKPANWIVTGGGAMNQTLMRMLRERLHPATVETANSFGWSGDSMEAQAFGYLAARGLRGLPLSYPATTGVPLPMTGGVLAEPR